MKIHHLLKKSDHLSRIVALRFISADLSAGGASTLLLDPRLPTYFTLFKSRPGWNIELHIFNHMYGVKIHKGFKTSEHTGYVRRIYEIFLKLIKKKKTLKITTCNLLDLELLGFWPSIPKSSPDTGALSEGYLALCAN